MNLGAWGISKSFRGGRAAFGGAGTTLKALRGVSLRLGEGESVGLVGESGGGKSTLLKILLGLESPDSGEIRADLGEGEGPFLLHPSAGKAGRKALAKFREQIGLVLQDPYTSLDPVWPVWRIVTEPLAVRKAKGRGERKRKAAELLQSVGLSSHDLGLHPESFSGGQRQRLALARALSSGPKVLFLDEPVSSLDVSVQAQILDLLKRIRQERALSFFVISHDLPTVGSLCDRIYVLYQGRIVEEGPARQILENPSHPYTRGLIQSRPLSATKDFLPLGDPGPVPPQGCGYAPRCPRATELCGRLDPPLFQLAPGHSASCLFPL